MPLNERHTAYLNSNTHGRLATIAPNGTPQNKPVGYRYNEALGTIDIGGFNMERSAKYRNITTNPDVSFVVDDIVGEGAERVRFIELRGRAEPAQRPSSGSADGLSRHVIRIHPRRVVSWNIEPGGPSMFSADLAAEDTDSIEPQRPAVGLTGPAARAAERAIADLVAELQEGLDRRDADIYDRHFAADVIWGSPFGATVTGFEPLNAIHHALNQRGVGGPASRYEIVHTMTPAPNIALAHVRRVAVEADGAPPPDAEPTASAFSEMALYVLVHRQGTWWLTAGQNTPIRLDQAPLSNLPSAASESKT